MQCRIEEYTERGRSPFAAWFNRLDATTAARVDRYVRRLESGNFGAADEGLSILRDLVHAEITFKELARQTGFGEKSLHRMLSPRGNPTARSLGKVLCAIREDMGCTPRVTVAATRADHGYASVAVI